MQIQLKFNTKLGKSKENFASVTFYILGIRFFCKQGCFSSKISANSKINILRPQNAIQLVTANNQAIPFLFAWLHNFAVKEFLRRKDIAIVVHESIINMLPSWKRMTGVELV